MDFDYRLLVKYILNELSSEETEQVAEWRNLSAENKSIFSCLVQLRISRNYKKYNTAEQTDKALKKINTRIDHVRVYKSLRNLWKYAAVLFLFLLLTFGGYQYFRSENYVSIVVKQGEGMKKVTLADGTNVWLNAASTLKIPESFSDKHRYVHLQGNAFFDVVKRMEPFFISTEYLNIGVYGTAFEVNIDDRMKSVETTLIRGSVSLLNQDWENILEMHPGEKVTFSQMQNQYTTEIVDTNLCGIWRLEQTIFENEVLRKIAEHLSQRFHINVNIESSRLALRRFRCVINKDESLTDILEHLKYLAPVDYKVEGSEVFIWESLTNK